jgi:hypothetical protein
MLRRLPLLLLLVAAPALALAQEGPQTVKSGPQPGSILTSAFDAFNLNGPAGKGRYHCLVCEYGLRPVVLVFARDHPKGPEKAVDDLLQRLDQAVGRDPDTYLKAFVVFLSPAAASSATETKETRVTDAEQLVKEAEDRQALLARLQPLADKLKHVVVTCYPAAGPAGYSVSPKADVTVVLYVKHKVTDNFAFPEGGLNEQAVDQILKRVDDLAGRARKKQPPPAKKEKEKGEKAASGGLGRQFHPLVEALPGALHRHGDRVVDLVRPQHVIQLLG